MMISTWAMAPFVKQKSPASGRRRQVIEASDVKDCTLETVQVEAKKAVMQAN